MPLYEYQCSSCNRVTEVMQKFSDAPLTECPECKGPVSKLVSLSSFALKGGGWYTTDYKRSESPKSEAAGCGASACGTPAAGSGCANA